MFAYQDMKFLESSESSQINSQNDRTSPEIPHATAAQFRGYSREFVTLRVAQFVLKIAHLATVEPR